MSKILVKEPSDLPELPKEVKELFLDVETNGLSPYIGDKLAGVAFSWDDNSDIYYVPVGHRDEDWNITWKKDFYTWLQILLNRSAFWVNHNVKFDGHFIYKSGLTFPGELIDTENTAKLIYSDRFTYGLKTLAKDWLCIATPGKSRIDTFLSKLKKDEGKKDYSAVPADLMCDYACEDVDINRQLHRYIEKRIPEETRESGLYQAELLLTKVLFDIELRGLSVDREELVQERYNSLEFSTAISMAIGKLTGLPGFVNSNKNLSYIIFSKFGLPIVKYSKPTKTNKRGNPSFDAEAVQLYLQLPEVRKDPVKKRTFELIEKYRKESTYLELFVVNYLHFSEQDGLIHSSYRQTIRTGRMSSYQPNATQLSKRAKALVKPRKGNAFLSFDASQIEFRFIVHYIKDPDLIKQYNEDPNTDIHSWVAGLCGIDRGPAKNINFAIAFGAGKARIVSMLSKDPLIIEGLGEGLSGADYQKACERRGLEVFTDYHNKLPGIKETSNRAARVCRQRGFVRNIKKRRRQLPPERAHIAFNTIIQGSAMDTIKMLLVKLSPLHNKYLRDKGVHIAASVHDEILFEGPIEVMKDPEVRSYIKNELEKAAGYVNLSVPITWDGGYSEINWAEAAGDDGRIEIS